MEDTIVYHNIGPLLNLLETQPRSELHSWGKEYKKIVEHD